MRLLFPCVLSGSGQMLIYSWAELSQSEMIIRKHLTEADSLHCGASCVRVDNFNTVKVGFWRSVSLQDWFLHVCVSAWFFFTNPYISSEQRHRCQPVRSEQRGSAGQSYGGLMKHDVLHLKFEPEKKPLKIHLIFETANGRSRVCEMKFKRSDRKRGVRESLFSLLSL